MGVSQSQGMWTWVEMEPLHHRHSNNWKFQNRGYMDPPARHELMEDLNLLELANFWTDLSVRTPYIVISGRVATVLTLDFMRRILILAGTLTPSQPHMAEFMSERAVPPVIITTDENERTHAMVNCFMNHSFAGNSLFQSVHKSRGVPYLPSSFSSIYFIHFLSFHFRFYFQSLIKFALQYILPQPKHITHFPKDHPKSF